MKVKNSRDGTAYILAGTSLHCLAACRPERCRADPNCSLVLAALVRGRLEVTVAKLVRSLQATAGEEGV